MYIYPSNLTARPSLLFWQLRDVAVAVVLIALGAVTVLVSGSPIILAVAAAYVLLSIRFEDNSVLDYLRYAWRFCVSQQQLFVWRLSHEE